MGEVSLLPTVRPEQRNLIPWNLRRAGERRATVKGQSKQDHEKDREDGSVPGCICRTSFYFINFYVWLIMAKLTQEHCSSPTLQENTLYQCLFSLEKNNEQNAIDPRELYGTFCSVGTISHFLGRAENCLVIAGGWALSWPKTRLASLWCGLPYIWGNRLVKTFFTLPCSWISCLGIARNNTAEFWQLQKEFCGLRKKKIRDHCRLGAEVTHPCNKPF